ncbi:MAG: sensor histidine kinase [Haliscomenobacteraceae bacterium CHB4]|nr:Adaptive-response sensory-kinase SasA [Saprospiraceae bacterium]MCE7923130.1 sensor histidine kinase [Haliscomenobacteraceae bacterium CHB4]
MLKRLLLYLVALAVLLAVAVSAAQWDKDTTLLQEHADQISAFLEEQESEALAWIKENRVALEAAASGKVPGNWSEIIESQIEKDYTIIVYQADSILAWTNNRVIPTTAQLKSLTSSKSRSLLRLPSGWFAACRESSGSSASLVLIPIRYAVGVAEDSEQMNFPADRNIPSQIQVTASVTDYPVQVAGNDLCYLEAAGPVHSTWLQWMKFVFFGLFFIVLFSLINQLAVRLAERFFPVAGAVLLVVVAGGCYWLNNHFNFTGQQFGGISLFSQSFDIPSLIGKSLGDWLINIGLLSWLIVYFHRHFRMGTLAYFSVPVRFALCAAFYVAAMLCILAGVEVLRRLVFYSGIEFDFDNIFQSDWSALLAIGGVILLMGGLFLFSHRMMMSVKRAGLPTSQRGIALGVGAVVMYAICAMMGNDLLVGSMIIVGLSVVYAALFDVFVHWEAPGFGWMACWLLIFSMFASLLLYHYNLLKDRDIRIAYAQALTDDRDMEAVEQGLPELLASFQRDSQRLNTLLKPWPFKPNAGDLRDHFNTFIFTNHYLFQHYRLNVFAFDRGVEPILLEQPLGYEYVMDNWSRGKPLPGAPGIRFRTDEDGKFRYMMELHAQRMNDPSQPAKVYCFLDHDYPAPARVYVQLFNQLPYKNLQRLARYDFAVLKNGKLIVEQGQGNGLALNTPLNNGESRDIETSGPRRVDAVFKSADGQSVASVGRLRGGWHKQVYLFSILFTLASLLLFLLALANTWLHFLPEKYRFQVSARGSLAKRIQYWTVTLVGIAFLVLGWITYQHFSDASKNAQRANLDYRAEAVLTSLKTRLVGSALSADSLRRLLPQTLADIAGSLSMDANLYSPAGNLEFTTQEDLSGLGILPGKMNPVAQHILKNNNQPEMIEAERSAGLDYFTKYLPLRTGQNELLGFLGVPYLLDDRKIGSEVSDFIGMLASLYVFLLLVAFVVTYLLARSIIRPLSLVSDKIRSVKLSEDKNQTLDYQGDEEDEVSELIGEYNRMVDKLEASKQQLVRLEREGAWREMARQVAHDIKNPLTTMKLSMQQLERVSSNPEQAAAYLRKAITRLIEQIDSLAQIASEFSMFANLDIRQKSDVVLNDVVESVYDLFSEQRNVSLDLKIPPERFHILGDKNHLIRVFNNLVINAIQAIPSDREGQIRVSLARQNGHATVKISDNGGGIPPEIRERVFEPNFTTKTSGSGLGLAICKKIIEAHDGTIRFETRENEGTDFFVEMPITAVG